jgi:hypothetical protein
VALTLADAVKFLCTSSTCPSRPTTSNVDKLTGEINICIKVDNVNLKFESICLPMFQTTLHNADCVAHLELQSQQPQCALVMSTLKSSNGFKEDHRMGFKATRPCSIHHKIIRSGLKDNDSTFQESFGRTNNLGL